MISKLRSLLTAQPHLPRPLLIAAANALFALQLQSGDAQTGNEQAPSPSSHKGGQVVNVKESGAVGDGITDDTAAFNAALKEVADAGGGVCLAPNGTYIISASGMTAPYKPAVSSGVHLAGEGRDSVLKVNGLPKNYLLQCDGDNWSVENLTFDMGDYTPRAGLAAIACKGNNWRVANCAIIKSGRWGIAAFGGNNWSIERNYISRTVPGARPPAGAILVSGSAGVWSNHGSVIDNFCAGAGITFSGDNGIIALNNVTRSGFGSGIFVQGSPSTHAPTIRGNVCSNGSSGFDATQAGKWWSVNGFEVWAPDSVVYNNIAHDNDGGGFAIGGPNSIVVGNKAYNNGRTHHGYAGFNARVNPAQGSSASHSVFLGNLAYDTRYPSSEATQDYGYAEQAGELTDIKHLGNDYNRNRIGPAKSHAGQAGQMQVPTEMKNKLRGLADDPALPDTARRAVRQFLAR